MATFFLIVWCCALCRGVRYTAALALPVGIAKSKFVEALGWEPRCAWGFAELFTINEMNVKRSSSFEIRTAARV
jgi:hypothetical protein